MRADQEQAAVVVEHARAGPVQQPQPGAVEELHATEVDDESRVGLPRDLVQLGEELHGRGDVDLPAELQHGVTAVLVDAQMPGRRCGFLLHDDIASNRPCLGARESFPRTASYPRWSEFEHVRLTYVFELRPSVRTGFTRGSRPAHDRACQALVSA
jgi:hypothetical protein